MGEGAQGQVGGAGGGGQRAEPTEELGAERLLSAKAQTGGGQFLAEQPTPCLSSGASPSLPPPWALLTVPELYPPPLSLNVTLREPPAPAAVLRVQPGSRPGPTAEWSNSPQGAGGGAA